MVMRAIRQVWLKSTTNHRMTIAEMLKVFEYSDPSTAISLLIRHGKSNPESLKINLPEIDNCKTRNKRKTRISEKEKKLLEKKEYNEWVDDSYLLIGKARFYKHEFNEAAALFNYCITDANDPEIRTEAAIWLARINNETGNYNESLRILSELEINENTQNH